MKRWLAVKLLALAYRLDRDQAEATAEYWLQVKRVRQHFEALMQRLGTAFQPLVASIGSLFQDFEAKVLGL